MSKSELELYQDINAFDKRIIYQGFHRGYNLLLTKTHKKRYKKTGGVWHLERLCLWQNGEYEKKIWLIDKDVTIHKQLLLEMILNNFDSVLDFCKKSLLDIENITRILTKKNHSPYDGTIHKICDTLHCTHYDIDLKLNKN